MRAAALVAFGSLVLSACMALVSCGALSPADEAAIGRDSVQIGACVASAHLCKVGGLDDGGIADCYRGYDECMAAHGFADAGKDGR